MGRLKITYKIGSSNSTTTVECKVSNDNPLKNFVQKALNKLTPKEGSWGIGLDSSCFRDNYLRGVISEKEYYILAFISELWQYNEEYDDDYFTKEEVNWLKEFENVFHEEIGLSFVVFNKCTIED